MSDFMKFKEAVAKRFEEICKDKDYLFVTDVDKEEIWNLYLDSFPPGTNEIYRERREHDCTACRHFIERIGNVVAIKNCEIETIWGIDINDGVYSAVAKELDKYVKSKAVRDIFVAENKKCCLDNNIQMLEDGNSIKWEHLYVEVPDRFVSFSYQKVYEVRDIKNVFANSLNAIDIEALDAVMELIGSNSLYKGEEWSSTLAMFKDLKNEYESIPKRKRELWLWDKSTKINHMVGKLKNHSIGVLLIDISEGMELDEAVRRYEQITAPENYKRSKPVYTKRMLEEAKKKIEELGLMDSLPRRYATVDDITVNDILFVNRNTADKLGVELDIFGEMEKGAKKSLPKFDRAEEISASDFISNVLPHAKEVELFVENKHKQNFVSLIAPVNKDAKTMFKWNNPYSWAYTGNVTDSLMKQRVKEAGGKIDGDLRFSIQWNDLGFMDDNDLDAHCVLPHGSEIFFGMPKNITFDGELDVDIRYPVQGTPAVENIVFGDRNRLVPGKYTFYVEKYSDRGGKSGFRAEIEFDGVIHYYNVNYMGLHRVEVATVIVDENHNMKLVEHLKSENEKAASPAKTEWGVYANDFVPVNAICYSPNFWEESSKSGHRHLFFMLKDCINPETPNGFYNEFLSNELYEHRKVLEALGEKCKVAPSEDQLSGVGFSMTKRQDVIVKVKGATERIVKVKF